jgi:hypothetical protein
MQMVSIGAAGVAALLVTSALTVVGADAGNVGADAGSMKPASCARCSKPPDGWAPIALVAADASCPAGSRRTETGVLFEGVRSTGKTRACTCSAPATNPCFVDKHEPITARTGGNGPVQRHDSGRHRQELPLLGDPEPARMRARRGDASHEGRDPSGRTAHHMLLPMTHAGAQREPLARVVDSQTVNVVPSSTTLSTSIRPPIRFTMSLEIDRPRPVPAGLVV